MKKASSLRLLLVFCFFIASSFYFINQAECESASSYYQKAKSFDAQGKYKEAEVAAKEALKIDNKFYKAHMMLGVIYTVQAKSSEAIKAFEDALKYAGDDKENLAIIYFDLGLNYRDEGNPEKSWEYLRKAYEMKSYLPEIWGKPNSLLRYVIDNNKEGFMRYAGNKKFINPSKAMAGIDGKHSEQEFLSILDKIEEHYPKLNKEDLASNIYEIYRAGKELSSNLSLYDFCVGFVKNSSSMGKSLREGVGEGGDDDKSIFKYYEEGKVGDAPRPPEDLKQRRAYYIGILRYVLALHASTLEYERNNILAQQFDYKEILPEQQSLFRDGQKYGLTIKVDIGSRENKAEYDSDSYQLIRPFTISIMKENHLIFSEIFNIVGYSSYLVDNTLDYATPVKYIVDGYQIAGSNGVLYLFQNYNYDIDKLLPWDKFHISVSKPETNSILLSIDNGASWIPIELRSAKTESMYLSHTDALLRRIISIEPLSEDKNYLKIGFIMAYGLDQPEYFNFKRVNDRYEIE